MNIKTIHFSPSRKDMFKVMVMSFFKKNWILKLMMIIMIGMIWISSVEQTMKLGLSFFVILYYGYLIFYYWIYTGSKSNRAFYIEREMILSDDGITVNASDGSQGNTNWDNVIKVTEVADVFLLYISKSIFYYLPKSAFKSENELNEFENFLEKGLKI